MSFSLRVTWSSAFTKVFWPTTLLSSPTCSPFPGQPMTPRKPLTTVLLCTWMTARKICGTFFAPSSRGRRQSKPPTFKVPMSPLRRLNPPARSLVGGKDYHPTFHTISAYARLGHKYQIEHLVTQTVGFLKGYHTHSFDKWEMNVNYEPAEWARIYAIGVVNMARLLGCHSVLPSALAVCCMLDPDELLDGFQREDGSLETLEKSDLVRCLRGKEILPMESVSALLRAFTCDLPKPQPCKRQPCSPWLDALDTARSQYPTVFGGASVIDEWGNCLEEALAVVGDKRLCKSCLAVLTARLRDEQKKIWNRLPELLDVEVAGWGQIEQPAEVRSSFKSPFPDLFTHSPSSDLRDQFHAFVLLFVFERKYLRIAKSEYVLSIYA